MSQKFGLSNVITHLHRELGLDRDSDQALFEYAYEVRNALKSHFASEGLELLIDLQLGAICLQVMDDDKIERLARDAGTEPFRPIYSSRAQSYWSSVLLVILRMRYESAIATPEAAWVFEDDLFAEFLRYHNAEHRENHGKVRDLMSARLRDLEGKGFVTHRTSTDRGISWSVTKWLVLRLTDEMLRRFETDLKAAITAADAQGERPGIPGKDAEDDPITDLFQTSRNIAVEPEDENDGIVGGLNGNAVGEGGSN